MPGETAKTLVRILYDDLHACDDRYRVLDFNSIPGMYDTIEWGWVWWWIDTFITDQVHKNRLAAILRVPAAFFADIAKLHKAETGEGLHIPGRLVLALQRRLLQAAYPYLDEITVEAQRAPAQRAAANLLKYIEVDRWRTKSSR